MADLWNTGWNEGWNVGYNARKSGQTSPQPTPVPTPTQYQSGGDPWNTGWNTGWNVGWNAYQPGQVPGATTTQPTGATSTNTAPTGTQPTQQTQTNDWGTIYRTQYPGWGETEALADWTAKGSPTSFGGGTSGSSISDYEQKARSDIESGYSSYFANLDKMLNEGLPAQETAQKGIVGSQYEQGVSALGAQKEQGLYELGRERERIGTGQARSLRDLASNLRNSFMAGNVYLGARGAGDSSASNMYSYALTKLGSQQRGDITRQAGDYYQQVADREFKLGSVYNSEVNRLSSERDQKVMSVASWFAEQQNALRQAQAQGQLAKGQDLASLSKTMLNQALSYLQQTDTEARNQKLMLEQWAMNNATNINQLKSNWAQISNFQTPGLTSSPIAGQISTDAYGNMRVPAGYGGYQTEEKKDTWGTPIKNYQNWANLLGQPNLLQGY